MKNEAEKFRKSLLGAYSKEETEFLKKVKKVKNDSEQGKLSEKYAFMPTAKEFRKHINETLKGAGLSDIQLEDDEENER